jgi:hypothetical protein
MNYVPGGRERRILSLGEACDGTQWTKSVRFESLDPIQGYVQKILEPGLLGRVGWPGRNIRLQVQPRMPGYYIFGPAYFKKKQLTGASAGTSILSSC